ncbi:MAG: glutamate racemase [Flavobacteriales bacterium]|nr:glutamate racemase [Flavobacteriales bacterium]
MNKLNPIGIFDSGIGGLTVAHAINKVLPNEEIIYFGDTKHLPYGNKTESKIRSYSNQITNFLIRQKCKAIIIGCNSASAIAFNSIKESKGNDALIINVIDPVIRYVQNDLSIRNIGIIGTNATIKSMTYEKKILNLRNDLRVSSIATPLLASLIEGNNKNCDINKIIKRYLYNKKFAKIDSLILGCTHYPIIQNQINVFYKNRIRLISSVNVIGQEVKKQLKKNALLNPNIIKKNTKHKFYVSNLTEPFQEKTKLFFPHSIILQEENIFS